MADTLGPGLFPPLFPATSRTIAAYSPTGWDRAQLGSDVVPAKSRVTKCNLPTKHNPKEAIGKHGGKPSLYGVRAAEIEMECTVWDDASLAALVAIRDKYYPPKVTRVSTPKPPASASTVSANGLQSVQPATTPPARKLTLAEQMNADGAIAFDHPAVRGLPMKGVVIIDASGVLDASEPHGAKKIVFKMLPWLPASSLSKANALNTPSRVNARSADAVAKAAAANPLPSEQPGVCDPGALFTPG